MIGEFIGMEPFELCGLPGKWIIDGKTQPEYLRMATTIGTLEPGEKVVIREEEAGNDGERWYLVRGNKKNGWIPAKYMKHEEEEKEHGI